MNLLRLFYNPLFNNSIFKYKVIGKPRIEDGHYIPAPFYWAWK